MSESKSLVVVIALLLGGTSARAVQCDANTVSSMLAIQFKGCGDPPDTPEKIYIDVEDTSVRPALVLKDQLAKWDKERGVWIAKIDGQVRVEKTRVFLASDKVRAYCRFGTAAKEPKSETGCGGKFEFYCDPKPWTLNVEPTPLKGKFAYERVHVEPTPNACTENGTLTFPPHGTLQTVGKKETVKVRIETPGGIFLCNYPVTYELLEKNSGKLKVSRDKLTPDPNASTPGQCQVLDAAVKTNPSHAALKNAQREVKDGDLSQVQFSW